MDSKDLAVKFGLTAISGMTAETVTFPIDLTKTRLQLQGELQHGGVRRGALGTAVNIVRAEGIGGLYKGVSAAIARHIPYTGSRILIYEQLKTVLAPSAEGAPPPGIGTKMALGATSGALGQFVAVPADVVKVRMQADGRLVAVGKLDRPRYTGLRHALSTIVRNEGLLGLWKGTGPAVQRAALVNLGELAAYDQSKQMVIQSGMFNEGLQAHVLAATCSGLCATICSSPADVIKTRMMNQKGDAKLYSSSIDCLRKTVQAEGLLSLYKGFFPTWMRLGPWQLVFWVSYEQLRAAMGIGGF
mmetsp:Transcript_25898/g.31435  ORF Transcript_25898/g.31435 Transcript_25898/m.31435 type:complete len:301 (-) Transcript_25898:438-1340(-)